MWGGLTLNVVNGMFRFGDEAVKECGVPKVPVEAAVNEFAPHTLRRGWGDNHRTAPEVGRYLCLCSI